jgi:spore maturation protein CgeB
MTYGNTKVNLNHQIPRNDFVYLNQKAFDIPMSGNFELSTIPQVVEIFEGKVGYTSEPEIRDKIMYYIEHEEERIRMAIKSYEVVISKHTYTYRMRDLLKKLKVL